MQESRSTTFRWVQSEQITYHNRQPMSKSRTLPFRSPQYKRRRPIRSLPMPTHRYFLSPISNSHNKRIIMLNQPSTTRRAQSSLFSREIYQYSVTPRLYSFLSSSRHDYSS